jgi:polyphosphate glucokinase
MVTAAVVDNVALGVDIGGSGIKGALVNLTTGELVTERHRIPTPEGATPQGVCDTVGELAKHFDWSGPIGVGFPAAIKPDGTVLTAANISKTWIGVNAQKAIEEATGSPLVRVVNDADAAGEAEMLFGAGKGVSGTVFLFTFGTGVGTALFVDGKLVPNTELGHMLINTPKGFLEGEHYQPTRCARRRT